jgi:uncharacterized membrane protein YdbT with pleckstrin-like domain
MPTTTEKTKPPSTLTPRGHALSSFIVRPQNIHFETQTEQEEVILLLRQHFSTNFGWIAVTAILALLPLFFIPMFLRSALIPVNVPSSYFVLIPLIWYLGVFGFALMRFLYWYFNIYMITNERVIDVDWYSLLYKQMSETKLDRIQDVTFKQHGFLDLFFNYGDIYIQTAGTAQNFEFIAVPNPNEVVQHMNQLVELM